MNSQQAFECIIKFLCRQECVYHGIREAQTMVEALTVIQELIAEKQKGATDETSSNSLQSTDPRGRS